MLLTLPVQLIAFILWLSIDDGASEQEKCDWHMFISIVCKRLHNICDELHMFDTAQRQPLISVYLEDQRTMTISSPGRWIIYSDDVIAIHLNYMNNNCNTCIKMIRDTQKIQLSLIDYNDNASLNVTNYCYKSYIYITGDLYTGLFPVSGNLRSVAPKLYRLNLEKQIWSYGMDVGVLTIWGIHHHFDFSMIYKGYMTKRLLLKNINVFDLIIGNIEPMLIISYNDIPKCIRKVLYKV